MPDTPDKESPEQTTVRLPGHYKMALEELRIALGARSAPKALATILDLPPAYLAECVNKHLNPQKGGA